MLWLLIYTHLTAMVFGAMLWLAFIENDCPEPLWARIGFVLFVTVAWPVLLLVATERAADRRTW